MCIISFYLPQTLVRWLYYPSFVNDKMGLEWLRDLPKVTQQKGAERDVITTWVCQSRAVISNTLPSRLYPRKGRQAEPLLGSVPQPHSLAGV